MSEREDIDNYFMKMAFLVATRATCTRRRVGSVLVLDKKVISTGYNGSPAGVEHCTVDTCIRRKLNIPSGQNQELCRGSHSEANAIAQAASTGTPTQGSTIYCTTKPCVYCAKMLINAGVKRIVFNEDYGGNENSLTDEILGQADVVVDVINVNVEDEQ